MFGHKTFLKIGKLSDSSISGLYRDSYEVDSCNYSFSQGTDHNGQPQTDVRGGNIAMTYGNIPPQELIQWMLSTGKLENGAIVICDSNDMPLEKIHFEDAACIGLEVEYSQNGQMYISTKIVLQARKLTIGDINLTNRWI